MESKKLTALEAWEATYKVSQKQVQEYIDSVANSIKWATDHGENKLIRHLGSGYEVIQFNIPRVKAHWWSKRKPVMPENLKVVKSYFQALGYKVTIELDKSYAPYHDNLVVEW